MTPNDSTPFSGFLAPVDPNWGGTGALYLTPDERDYSILLHPGVAQALHAGATGPVDLSSFIGGVMNQGNEGSCVAFSTSALCALDEALAGRPWPWLDAENLYRRNGGTGQNGVDSRGVLADVVANGVNRLNDPGPSVKEASYLFVPKQPGLFKDTIMAALNVRKPCVIATLLPQQFGWTSSGSPTSGYHQLLICGGDDTWCEVQNSWGPSWGENGKGRLLWSYLDPTRWDVFAYTVDPLSVPVPPVPVPPVPPVPVPPVPPVPVPPVPVPPVPPAGLRLDVQGHRYGAVCVLMVYLRDASGAAQAGTLSLSLEGQVVGVHHCYHLRPAVFIVQVPSGTAYNLAGTTMTGKAVPAAQGTLP